MGELINYRTIGEIKAAVINCDEHCSCIDCPEDEMGYCDLSVVIKYARLLIEHLEAQRDAALADMKGSRICALCAHWEAGINEPCMHCTFENNCFEWRGINPPKEDAHE